MVLKVRFLKILFELRKLVKGGGFDHRNTLLLTGSPRSGTTWLAQIFHKAGGSCLINEPLSLGIPFVRQAGLEWRTYLKPNEINYKVFNLITGIFSGKYIGSVSLGLNSPSRMLNAKALILKSIRANRLIPWLLKNKINSKPIVYILRHPLAVVSSQLRHPHMGKPKQIPKFDRLFIMRNLPHLTYLLDKLSTEEEFRTLTWCIDQYVPLTCKSSDKLITVFYEKLIRDSETELHRILSHIGMSITKKHIKALNSPSPEARSWSANHRQATFEERIGIWKEHLTKGQVAHILDIVNAFQIKGYSERVEPDFSNICVG